MKPAKNILLIGLVLLIFSACTANRIQRSYEDEITTEEVNNGSGTEIIIIDAPEPVYIPQPVIIEQPAPKTKVRTNSQGDSQKTQRETSNNNDVRNNTGQRNVKSRGR